MISLDLMSMIPGYYRKSKVINGVINQEINQISSLISSIDDLLQQFSVSTATWSLSDWETEYGLQPKSYKFLSWDLTEEEQLTFAQAETYTWDQFGTLAANEIDFEQRRANVISRMRGIGTVTKQLIQDVVKAYTYGDVDVIEDPANYKITIKFTSTVGVPPNLDEAKIAIREVIPAHLDVLFTNEFSLWNDAKATTWDNLHNYVWDDVKGGLWNA